jgi:hypothetical protein
MRYATDFDGSVKAFDAELWRDDSRVFQIRVSGTLLRVSMLVQQLSTTIHIHYNLSPPLLSANERVHCHILNL